jgi:sugar lactone lactonase YvrE
MAINIAASPIYRENLQIGATHNGQSPAKEAELSGPGGIVVDAAGNVYFSDGNSTVHKIATDGTISTFAGTTRTGFAGDGGPASAAELKRPAGLTLDAAGNLYIADQGNGRVRRWTRTESSRRWPGTVSPYPDFELP